VAAAVDYRLHEFDSACAAMRRGLVAVIPERALRLLTWREVENMACGDPVIDLQLLKSHTSYVGAWDKDHEAVRHTGVAWLQAAMCVVPQGSPTIPVAAGATVLAGVGRLLTRRPLQVHPVLLGSLPLAQAIQLAAEHTVQAHEAQWRRRYPAACPHMVRAHMLTACMLIV